LNAIADVAPHQQPAGGGDVVAEGQLGDVAWLMASSSF
jgi:hypothetical protein